MSNEEEMLNFGMEEEESEEKNYPILKRRPHRKALDIKNNGLSTDGLQIMLDRYTTNVNFIESIQIGSIVDGDLMDELRDQTASQIYTRCSKRDSFTELHVDDDIMATFSTIRDYRAACDMQRMDSDRFQQVFDQFASWDESKYEEFKRNYTLEYVFRRILQRDVRYRSRYMKFLKECQESKDYSKIHRPLLPLPTPKFITGDSQLELCNSSLRSKLRNLRNRSANSESSEISPESQAFLARLDEAVNSFFQRLDVVEDADWIDAASSNGFEPKKQSGGKRKRTTATVSIDRKSARPTMVNVLAKAFLKKAFRDASIHAQSQPSITTASPIIAHDSIAVSNGHSITELFKDPSAVNGVDHPPCVHHRPLASQRPSSYITKSIKKSINNISMMMMMKKANADCNGLSAGLSDSNGYDHESQPGSLLGVGADEPIDEEDLRSILDDLVGMYAVVKCQDLGRIIGNGSVQHPDYGTVLVRRNRVVRLGSAFTGFHEPNPNMEFQFPMEHLADYIQADKIRFDDDRNLYLNGLLTEFYFLPD